LLGGCREIGDYTAAIVRQPSANNNRGIVFSALSAKQQTNSNRGTVFSVRSVTRCYEKENWNNELVLGQSPPGKNTSTEAEDIVDIRYQATAVKT
jgi:hypothetical protein